MDNRIFNVNGRGTDMLQKALELAFIQNGRNTTCNAWKQTKENGLILLWSSSSKDAVPLPSPLSHEQCIPLIEGWLNGDFSKSVQLSEFCEDHSHDGENRKGWQMYCENWGHVGGEHYAICAIKPAYMWYGK